MRCSEKIGECVEVLGVTTFSQRLGVDIPIAGKDKANTLQVLPETLSLK